MDKVYKALADIAVATFGSFIGDKLFSRLPLLVSGIALMVAATAAYLFLSYGFINSVRQSVPDVVGDVWGWVMPYNSLPCLAAVYAAKIARWTHDNSIAILKMKTKVLAS